MNRRTLLTGGVAAGVVALGGAGFVLWARDGIGAWREAVLPPALSTFAIELGRPETWVRFTGSIGRVIGLERFGASAPAKVLAKEFGFVADAVARTLKPAVTSR